MHNNWFLFCNFLPLSNDFQRKCKNYTPNSVAERTKTPDSRGEADEGEAEREAYSERREVPRVGGRGEQGHKKTPKINRMGINRLHRGHISATGFLPPRAFSVEAG